MKRFAYSLDREDYTGSYETPEEAVAAAMAYAEGVSSPPTEIYVGELVGADPQATGHAQQITEAMTRRAQAQCGEEAKRYLRNVSKEQAQDLDQALASTIVDWLKRNQLLPTFQKVANIREYPVPYPGQMPLRQVAEPDEVSDIGEPDPSIEVSF